MAMDARKNLKIVALGDSLTAGLQTQCDVLSSQMWTPYSHHLVKLAQRYLKRLQSEVEVQIVNKGVCGDRTIDMLHRFARDVAQQQPDHVIILGGTNDLGWNLDPTKILHNLREIYSIAESHKIRPVACAIPSILGFDDLIAPRLHLNRLIRVEAEKRRISFIDLFVATADPRTNRLLERCSGDGLHLNSEGYEKVAEAIFNEWLRRQLDELPTRESKCTSEESGARSASSQKH